MNGKPKGTNTRRIKKTTREILGCFIIRLSPFLSTSSTSSSTSSSAGINGNHQAMDSSRKSGSGNDSSYKPPEGLDLIGWKLQNPNLPIPSTWREQ